MKVFIVSITMVLVFSGCALLSSKYQVTVNSKVNQQIAMAKTYRIHSKDTLGVEVLNRVLKAKGYQKVQESTNANIVITLNYGIKKDHEKKEVYVDPELSMMGYKHQEPYEGVRYDPFYGGYTHYDNDFYKGTFRSYSTTYIYYDRFVTLVAKNKAATTLWSVDVSSIGESQDLKKIVPLLVKATEPYIGTNTKAPVKLEIQEGKS
jgi:hypothetical protein